MSESILYKSVIEFFQIIATNHAMVNQFRVGEEYDTTTLHNKYPLLYLDISQQNMIQENVSVGFNQMYYNISLWCYDKVMKDGQNREQVYSDTLYILDTIVAHIRDGKYAKELGIRIIGQPVSFKQHHKHDDDLNGWLMRFQLRTPANFNLCNSPISPYDFIVNNDLGIDRFRLIGPQGFQGPSNGSGSVTGPQGPIGFQGLIGSTGFQGFQGFIGNTGNQGPLGFQGSQGFNGITGIQGPTGIAGGFSITYTLEGGATFVPHNLEMEGLNIPTTTRIRASYLDYYNNDMLTQLTLWDIEFQNSPRIILKIYDITDNTYYHYFACTGGDPGVSSDGLDIRNPVYLGGCADDLYGLRPVGLSIFVQGDMGFQGPTGNNGVQGFQGNVGSGVTGSQGPQGFQGFTGPQGGASNSFNIYTVQSFTTSSVSNSVVPGLTFSTEPGSRYMMQIMGYFRTNNASGNPGFGIDGGSGATLSGWVRRGTTTAPTSNQAWIINGDALQGAATMTANTDFPFVIEGILITPNFAGTASMICTSVSPHILTIQPNSVMLVHKIG